MSIKKSYKLSNVIINRILWLFSSLASVLLIVTAMVSSVSAQGLDRPPLDANQDSEVDYYPAIGHKTSTNPSAFIWLPEKRADSYILQYSRSLSFSPEVTTTIRDLEITIHIPTEIMEPGTWYWRYGYNDGSRDVFSRKRRFEIPETATPFPFIPIERVLERIPKERPRLNFTPELVQEIRSDTQGQYSHLTEDVIVEADEILAMKEPLFEEPKAWDEYEDWIPVYVKTFQAMRPYTQRMVTSALAWLYTGDERYADEAKRRLMHFMSWDVDGPSSTVGVTELGMDIAEHAIPVFDWIYDTLSEKELETCRRVLSARMHQISYEVHRSRPMETKPFSSHEGRMVGFVVEGSIVLAHETEEVADWLEYTLKLLWSTYPAWSYDSGGWHQGISYWGSYMRRMIRVVAQLESMDIPLKDKPFFQNTGYFGLYAAYPNRPTRAFGDSHEMPVGEQIGRLLYALSTIYQNPYFRWHAEISNAKPEGRSAFINLDPDLEARPPSDLPQSRLFEDVGIVAMHSDMADPSENVMMIFRSDPFGALSHNFPAQNAFVIEAYGEPLAISTGARHIHGSDHHQEWMWHTQAHNSIMVDGEGQEREEINPRGKIIEYEENGEYAYTVGDATEAYGGRLDRFHRHMLFIRPGVFVIIDDLKTSGMASTFQWLLHAPTEIQVDEDNRVLVSRSGNSRLTTRFLTPDDIEFRQHTGFATQVVDSTIMSNQFHLTASTVNPDQTKQFLTVMKVDRIDGDPIAHPEPPSTPRRQLEHSDIEDVDALDDIMKQVESLEAEGGIALRIDNDLILWKRPGSWRVKAAGMTSTKNVVVKKEYFQ